MFSVVDFYCVCYNDSLYYHDYLYDLYDLGYLCYLYYLCSHISHGLDPSHNNLFLFLFLFHSLFHDPYFSPCKYILEHYSLVSFLLLLSLFSPLIFFLYQEQEQFSQLSFAPQQLELTYTEKKLTNVYLFFFARIIRFLVCKLFHKSFVLSSFNYINNYSYIPYKFLLYD
jgi:hypothetical protein